MDDQDFDEAFMDLYPRARALAFHILADMPAAEDIAAEALTRAYARWRHVSGLDYRDAWVLRVTSNLAIDAGRRRWTRWIPGMVPNHDDNVSLRIDLLDALRRLPARQRQAVALRYLADLDVVSVAAALHISKGSVKTHVHRGLAALRTHLDIDLSEVDRVAS